MGTGSGSTFAIAWSDTEIDGLASAPPSELAIGASWSWTGRAVRIDGPQDVLYLDRAHGAAELKDRAARRAPRFPGVDALPPRPNTEDGQLDPDGPLRDGFTVTDGRRQYPVAVLRDPASPRMLLAFPGPMPPPRTELWITAMTDTPRHEVRPGRRGVICFTEGTMVRTPDGDRRVEELMPGDRVLTRDDGPQEVYWTGHTRISGARLHVMPDLRPIRIRARALGGDLPESELTVSPSHRVLIRGAAARALFSTDEVLVAARDLVNDSSITIVNSLRGLTYHHLMLGRHQIVWANGVPSDSFHPADAALDALDGAQVARMVRQFPQVAEDPTRYGAPARRMLGRAEAAILRHDAGARTFGRAGSA